MRLRGQQLSEQIKKRVVELHAKGLNFEMISKRLGVSARHCSRIVKAAQKMKLEEASKS